MASTRGVVGGVVGGEGPKANGNTWECASFRP